LYEYTHIILCNVHLNIVVNKKVKIIEKIQCPLTEFLKMDAIVLLIWFLHLAVLSTSVCISEMTSVWFIKLFLKFRRESCEVSAYLGCHGWWLWYYFVISQSVWVDLSMLNGTFKKSRLSLFWKLLSKNFISSKSCFKFKTGIEIWNRYWIPILNID